MKTGQFSLLAAVIMQVVLLPLIASANPVSGRSTISAGPDIDYFSITKDLYKQRSKQGSTNANFKINWKLWTLFGESVDNSNASWSFKSEFPHIYLPRGNWDKKILFNKDRKIGISVTQCLSDGISTPASVIADFCVPIEVLRNIKVTELQVNVYFEKWLSGKRNTYRYTFDVGAMKKPGVRGEYGEISFNSPGSKDWKYTFKDGGGIAFNDRGEYLSVEKSMQFFKVKPKAIGAKIENIKYDFTKVISYLLDRAKKNKMSSLKEEDNQRFEVSSEAPEEEFSYDPLGDLEDSVYEEYQDNDFSGLVNRDFNGAEKALSSRISNKKNELKLTRARISKRKLPKDPNSLKPCNSKAFEKFPNENDVYEYKFRDYLGEEISIKEKAQKGLAEIASSLSMSDAPQSCSNPIVPRIDIVKYKRSFINFDCGGYNTCTDYYIETRFRYSFKNK